ncbi:MAG: hypothetical protein HUJ56_07415, partial [Erysipelotrichaceae bacterium]|nr:hypothetical protein [Erysipelotrichaceae bacterium]
NEKIAVGFKQASVYSVMELAGVDAEFQRKQPIFRYVPYIDNIYYIDAEHGTLAPISYKMYPNDDLKTVKSKIQRYDNIFKTLSVDEFPLMESYIKAIIEKGSEVGNSIKYVYPAMSCPKCGNMTEEFQTTAEQLVFTRYQLGALVTNSLNY